MKILIIDNNVDLKCWGSQDLCRQIAVSTAADADVTVHVRRAPQNDLPSSPKGFDRIIVSGSKTSVLMSAPWVDELLKFIKKAVDARIPYLGICYGHQMLARALGGIENVRKAKKPEFGWTEILLSGESPLTQGLPSPFYTFSSHYDEVCLLPPGMKRLAYSQDCEVQACQLENLPIYGIQFHPERTLEEGREALKERKKEGKPKYLFNPDRGQKLYQPQVGETLFKNFLVTSS